MFVSEFKFDGLQAACEFKDAQLDEHLHTFEGVFRHLMNFVICHLHGLPVVFGNDVTPNTTNANTENNKKLQYVIFRYVRLWQDIVNADVWRLPLTQLPYLSQTLRNLLLLILKDIVNIRVYAGITMLNDHIYTQCLSAYNSMIETSLRLQFTLEEYHTNNKASATFDNPWVRKKLSEYFLKITASIADNFIDILVAPKQSRGYLQELNEIVEKDLDESFPSKRQCIEATR